MTFQMKEITINIPEDSSELVINLVEKLGGSVNEKNGSKLSKSKRKNRILLAKGKNENFVGEADKNIDISIKKPSRNIPKKVSQSNKKTKKEKIDHTYLFGKWKDFDIDAKKLREESW